MKAEIPLSLILCSRNDNYMGNSLWRLQTALNFLAESVHKSTLENEVEVLVSDWGSEISLRESLNLTPLAAKLTSFLEVSPSKAQKAQKDSPFAEVLALNAAVRRARGEYIGRIDQDTLVTSEFFTRFFEIYKSSTEINFSLHNSYLFVGRRSLPYGFSSKCPSFSTVKRFLKLFQRLLPMDGPHIVPWFDVPTGIMLLHHDLWEESCGYDERLLYWGWMETDLGYRLGQKYTQVNLRPIMGRSFFHLEHINLRTPKIHRRKNPRKKNLVLAPNDSDWGLVRNNLPLHKCANYQHMEDQTISYAKDFLHLWWGFMGIMGLWCRYLLLKCYGHLKNWQSRTKPIAI